MCTHHPPRVFAAGLAALLIAIGSSPLPRAEAAQAAQPAARVEPGLTLDVEGFCSETRLYPDAGVGVVVLLNVSQSSGLSRLCHRICERIRAAYAR